LLRPPTRGFRRLSALERYYWHHVWVHPFDTHIPAKGELRTFPTSRGGVNLVEELPSKASALKVPRQATCVDAHKGTGLEVPPLLTCQVNFNQIQYFS
jgi:hypothetical protein